MCLILFAYRAHPDYPLVLAANRDEFYDRPSAPAQFWPPSGTILGGRDLSAGGTWLAVSKVGKLAAVTNFRDAKRDPAPRSRGHLVSEYVGSEANAQTHLRALHSMRSEYGGFNLLLVDAKGMHYTSNKAHIEAIVPVGVHGLSNHLLDTAWPKVETGKAQLTELLGRSPEKWGEGLFALLAKRSQAPDYLLPHTGVGPDWEKKLSAAFIHSPGYGTRASTIILWRRDGRLDFIERGFDAEGHLLEERRFVIEGFGS